MPPAFTLAIVSLTASPSAARVSRYVFAGNGNKREGRGQYIYKYITINTLKTKTVNQATIPLPGGALCNRFQKIPYLYFHMRPDEYSNLY